MALLLPSVLLLATCYFLQSACEPVSANNVGVIGGHNAHIQDVPFIAAILQSGQAVCVGTIVHKSFILTSASCAMSQRQVVLVGTARLHRGGKLHEIEEIICHHNYEPRTGLNDICLLKLKQKVQIGRRVSRVRLPDPNEQIANGTLFNVTGWGSMDTQGHKYPERLQQITVPLMSNESCNKLYGDNMICSFLHGRGGCFGDSGAPLTSNNVQFGLLSRVKSMGCGILPTVYTRLTKYLDWINLMITMYND